MTRFQKIILICLRCFFFLTISVIQIIVFRGTAIQLYFYLRYVLTRICVAIAILMFFLLFQILKGKRFFYLLILGDCLGIFISLLTYRNILYNLGSHDVYPLHRFIAFPYVICVFFSLFIWLLIKNNKGYILKASYITGKIIFSKICLIIVFLACIVFFCLGVYFIVLEHLLLTIWSFYSSIISGCFLWNIQKHKR